MLPDFNKSVKRITTPRRIYVASSWRNPWQPQIVHNLRRMGHEVYDFRHPTPADRGFSWSEVDPEWASWTADHWRHALETPFAKEGYAFDKNALDWADTTIMVLPCGMSASWELGYAVGKGQETYVYSLDNRIQSAELMFSDSIILTSHVEFELVFDTLSVDAKVDLKREGKL
jgi:hypothetical protein